MRFDELAARYRGTRATRYDSERTQSAKWSGEQRCMGEILRVLPRGAKIVDIPVGTGRFIELYKEHGVEATGLDVSPDMLREARAKAEAIGATIELAQADIRKIDRPSGSADAVFCIRFLNWIEFADVRTIVRELVRVSRSDLVLALRYHTPLVDLLRDRQATRLARQVVGRARRRFSDGLRVHERDEIEQLFRDLSLTVISANCIQQRRDGTDYYFYHLRKSGS